MLVVPREHFFRISRKSRRNIRSKFEQKTAQFIVTKNRFERVKPLHFGLFFGREIAPLRKCILYNITLALCFLSKAKFLMGGILYYNYNINIGLYSKVQIYI